MAKAKRTDVESSMLLSGQADAKQGLTEKQAASICNVVMLGVFEREKGLLADTRYLVQTFVTWYGSKNLTAEGRAIFATMDGAENDNGTPLYRLSGYTEKGSFIIAHRKASGMATSKKLVKRTWNHVNDVCYLASVAGMARQIGSKGKKRKGAVSAFLTFCNYITKRTADNVPQTPAEFDAILNASKILADHVAACVKARDKAAADADAAARATDANTKIGTMAEELLDKVA